MKRKVLLLLIMLVPWLLLPFDYLLHFTNDDSYFYLQTALNFASGLGSTFDGINQTNGYHPLWFLILISLIKFKDIFFYLNREELLRGIFLFTGILTFLSVLLIEKIYRMVYGKDFLLEFLNFILLAIPLVFFYLIGLENQILILLIIALIYVSVIEAIKKRNVSFHKSILLSLLFLSRVDLFWFIIVGILIYEILINRKVILREYTYLIVPIITFMGYVITNKILFQTFYPISSYYKLSLDILENLKFAPLPKNYPIEFMLVLIILFGFLLVLLASLKEKNSFNHYNKFLIMLFIVGNLFLLFNLFFNKNGIREWYYSFTIFISILLIVDFLRIWGRHFYYILLIVVVIFNLFYFFIFRANYYNHTSAYTFAKLLKEKVDRKSTIYQIDYSGLIGFFSERRVINGDGLINTHEYYKAVISGNLKDYIYKTKPDYFVFYSFFPPIHDSYVLYNFKIFKDYTIKFRVEDIVSTAPFLYGGIFRRKVGNFYLIKMHDYEIIVK